MIAELWVGEGIELVCDIWKEKWTDWVLREEEENNNSSCHLLRAITC